MQANDPMIHDTATFEQDVQNSIPFLATAVQCRNSVTNATKFAINVTETSVASLTTLASDKFSKSTLKTLFEKILKDINLNSDMASKINYNKCSMYKRTSISIRLFKTSIYIQLLFLFVPLYK